MRLPILIAASVAALALNACNRSAEPAEEHGEAVEAGSVTDPAAATVTMDQAAADAAAAAEAVQATEAQPEAPVAAAPEKDAPATPAPAAH